MFDNNLTLLEVDNSTLFKDANTFINKNNDEYYGYYRILPSNCTLNKVAFMHINKNQMKYIEVDRYTKVKDFFGTTDNVFISSNTDLEMNFDKINISDDDLIPIDIHDVDTNNDRILVIKKINGNSILLHYNTGIRVRLRNTFRYFYVQKIGYHIHAFLNFTKNDLIEDYPSQTHEAFRVKDSVNVRFHVRNNIR